jgi:hypothetical protein
MSMSFPELPCYRLPAGWLSVSRVPVVESHGAFTDVPALPLVHGLTEGVGVVVVEGLADGDV